MSYFLRVNKKCARSRYSASTLISMEANSPLLTLPFLRLCIVLRLGFSRDRYSIFEYCCFTKISKFQKDVRAIGNFPPQKQPYFNVVKDGAYYCYCAYVLRILRYSSFLSVMLTNTVTFLLGLKLSGESRS